VRRQVAGELDFLLNRTDGFRPSKLISGGRKPRSFALSVNYPPSCMTQPLDIERSAFRVLKRPIEVGRIVDAAAAAMTATSHV